jgi:hypothetical protein
MHTGKEGTEAMPYFDTFDLETIDILLISQYVPPFPFSVSCSCRQTISRRGGLGRFQRQGFEDEHDKLQEIVSIAGELLKLFPRASPTSQIVLLEQTGNTNLFAVHHLRAFNCRIFMPASSLPTSHLPHVESVCTLEKSQSS